MRGLFKSPVTSLGAILSMMLLISIEAVDQLDSDPATVADWRLVGAAIPMLVAMAGASDHKEPPVAIESRDND